MKISIYNENCVSAGRSVSEAEIDRAGEDAGDWTRYEGEPEELLAIADDMPTSTYGIRAAETIRQAVYFERPDLEQVEDDDEDDD